MLKIILKVVYVGIISSRTDTRNPISGKSNKAILHFFLSTDLKKSSSMANKKKKKALFGAVHKGRHPSTTTFSKYNICR